ncbi:hypothetical protein, partial [Bartonella gabonensis]|uniref:hypothetical protein n=1 Tax=Bartonella gabonensis TaxID=2699889 RepID=UPI001AEE775D
MINFYTLEAIALYIFEDAKFHHSRTIERKTLILKAPSSLHPDTQYIPLFGCSPFLHQIPLPPPY